MAFDRPLFALPFAPTLDQNLRAFGILGLIKTIQHLGFHWPMSFTVDIPISVKVTGVDFVFLSYIFTR